MVSELFGAGGPDDSSSSMDLKESDSEMPEEGAESEDTQKSKKDSEPFFVFGEPDAKPPETVNANCINHIRKPKPAPV